MLDYIVDDCTQDPALPEVKVDKPVDAGGKAGTEAVAENAGGITG